MNNPIHVDSRDNTGRSYKQTILEAVHAVVTQMKEDLDRMEKTTQNPNQGNSEKVKLEVLAKMDGWKGALGERILRIMEDEAANQNTGIDKSTPRFGSIDAQNHLRRAIEYFTQLEEVLLCRGAKTWKELRPDAVSLPDDFYRPGFYDYCRGINTSILGFTKLSKVQSAAVPTHQIPSYEVLFEACCSGDNAKIEQLCLPKKGKDGQELIQITSRFGGDGWGKFMSSIAAGLCTHFAMTGVSPLTLALKHRHWATARLILAIATAQYQPQDVKVPKFMVTRVTLGAVFPCDIHTSWISLVRRGRRL